MKTLTTLTAAILVVTSFAASAGEKNKALKSESPVVRIMRPEFIFGSPDDISHSDIEGLKNLNNLKSPEFVWGNPEDISGSDIEALRESKRSSLPAFIWGTPEEPETKTVRLLKVLAPSFEWGTPDDIKNEDVEALR